MNEPRVLRFAIAPFVFAFWVGLSFTFVPLKDDPISAFRGWKLEDVGAVIAAVGASAIPVGFMISSATVLILRILGNICSAPYEGTDLDKPVGHWTAKSLRTATAAHIHTPADLSAWVDRRWNAFMTWANAATATLLAFLIAPCTHPTTRIALGWYWASIVGFAVLVMNAWCARAEVMEMLRLHRKLGTGSPPP